MFWPKRFHIQMLKYYVLICLLRQGAPLALIIAFELHTICIGCIPCIVPLIAMGLELWRLHNIFMHILLGLKFHRLQMDSDCNLILHPYLWFTISNSYGTYHLVLK